MEEKSRSACTGGYREISYDHKKRRIETKIVNGVDIGYIDGVYLPHDDSEILLNTVDYVVKHVQGFNVGSVLEIGSGTGYVTAKLLANNDLSYAILIDIDPRAVYSSWTTIKINKLDDKADVVQCDGASCIRSNSVGIIYFNPPYLPVCDELEDAIAWNGGEGGLEVWTKFFEEALNVCRKEPCFIVFVFSTIQKIEDMLKRILSCEHIELIDCKFFFYEMLCGVWVKCSQGLKS